MSEIENVKISPDEVINKVKSIILEAGQELEEIAVDQKSARLIISLIQESGFEEAFLDTLSNIGVKHGIRVYIGDYGNGRSLIIQEDIDEDAKHGWYDYESYGGVGGWFPSSAGC